MPFIRVKIQTVFLLLASAILASCSAARVEPADGSTVSLAEMKAESYADSRNSLSEFASTMMTVPLPANGVAVVDRSENSIFAGGDASYSIVRFDGRLSPTDTVTIDRDRDETNLFVAAGADAIHLLSLLDDGDSIDVIHRSIPHRSTTPSGPKRVHRFFDDYESGSDLFYSPDRSHAAFLVFGEDNEYDDPATGAEKIEADVDAVVLDLRDGSTRTVSGRLSLPDGWDTDDGTMHGLVDNSGEVTAVMIGEMRNDRYTFVMRSDKATWRSRQEILPSSSAAVLPPDLAVDDPRGLFPAPFLLAHTPAGEITFVVPMYHDHARALLRGTVDRKDLSIDYETAICFTEDIVESMSDGEEDEIDASWILSELIPHADGSMTVMFMRRNERTSYSSMREEFREKVEFGPTIVARIGSGRSVLSSRFIDSENEYLTENHAINHEPPITFRHTAENLVFGIRSREEDGYIVYTMPLGASGRDISEQKILVLDDSDHFVANRDAIWFGDRDLFVPVQIGANDEEVTLVRVTW